IVGIIPPTADYAITNMLHPQPEIIEIRSVPSEGPWLLVRASSKAEAITTDLRRAVAAVDKDTPVANMALLEETITDNLGKQRSLTELLGMVAGLAVMLAAVGIYGVLSYLVSHRRHEIGVRMALGAQREDVVRLMLGHGLRLATLGIVLGLAVSWASQRVL